MKHRLPFLCPQRSISVIALYRFQANWVQNTNKSHRDSVIVSKTSAAYNGIDGKFYNILELEGDHRTMIKFDSMNRIGYRSLSGRIRNFVDRAAEMRRAEEEGVL